MRVLRLTALLLLVLPACSQPNEECTPSCAEAVCGDDGCGGSCGSCGADEACAAGVCEPSVPGTNSGPGTNGGTCGNGELDPGETCDPTAAFGCPQEAGCEPLGACFTAEYVGSEATCNAQCVTSQITVCQDGDGCCPTDCHPENDRDCVPETCGNGVLDPGETCDEPNFPCITECEPANECEYATLLGFDYTCVVSCNRVPLTSCSPTPDGCCPDGCSAAQDADCAAANRCAVLCERAQSYCTGEHALWATETECLAACEQWPTGIADATDGDSVECRITRLADAEADPDTHCAAAAPDATEGCVDAP